MSKDDKDIKLEKAANTQAEGFYGDEPRQEGMDSEIEMAPEVDDEVSKVAVSQGRNILVFIILVIASLILLYFVFFGFEPSTAPVKESEKKAAEVPVEKATRLTEDEDGPSLDVGIIDAPEPAPIESGVIDTPPPPDITIDPTLDFPEPDFAEPIEPVIQPEPPVEEDELPILPPVDEDDGDVDEDFEEDEIIPGPIASPEDSGKKKNRRKASMVVMNAAADGEDGAAGGGLFGFGRGSTARVTLQATSAEQAIATQIGRLDYTIAQGKILDAVLETAVNTDLPGLLRAVVTRDIYAESGKNILIPRGSRLIGSYDSEIVRRQQRLDVIWNRLLRPDGVDIFVDSPGVDQLGRAGIKGVIDNKYKEMLGNAALVTAVGMIASSGLSSVAGAGDVATSSTSNTDGSTTASSVGQVSDIELAQGISGFRDKLEGVAEGFLEEKPTMVIDQGTKLKVFVNKDLLFPPSAAIGSVKVIN